jgi:hypothetical protein
MKRMKAIDFSKSFVTFRIDLRKKSPVTVSHKPPFSLNNARIQLDCRCEIAEKKTGRSQEFVLGVSCKTERVAVEKDIWTEPNADFIPIFSRDQFMNVKTFDYAGKQVMLYPPSLGVQPERQVGSVADAFDSVRIDVAWVEGEVLETNEQVVAAILANAPVMARTQIENPRYVAVIDYPVKTMNASERENFFQPDTGPILLPDLTREPADLIAGFELAFAAFNCHTWVEFLVRTPTPIGQGLSVYHYSKSVRMDSQNWIVKLK